MKRDYIKYFVGLAACSFLGLTSCDDDKDLGGKMDEMITVSTIALNEMQPMLMCNGLRRMNLLLLLHGKVRS